MEDTSENSSKKPVPDFASKYYNHLVSFKNERNLDIKQDNTALDSKIKDNDRISKRNTSSELNDRPAKIPGTDKMKISREVINMPIESKKPSTVITLNCFGPKIETFQNKQPDTTKNLGNTPHHKSKNSVQIYNAEYEVVRNVEIDESDEMLEKINRPEIESDYVLRVIFN